MTGRRPLILAVTGWLAIVAVGSTMVWTVVAQAGRDVAETGNDTLAASSSTGPPTGIGEPTASALPSSEQPTGSADPSASPTASPTEPEDTASATDGGTEPGDDGSPTPPSPDPTKGQPSGGPSHPGDPDDDTTIAPPVETHRGTWQGSAGTVVASCTGAKISLVAAQPNSGWRVEVGDKGPAKLSVHFELTEGEDDDRHEDRQAARALAHEVEVHAKCSGGRPAFSLDD